MLLTLSGSSCELLDKDDLYPKTKIERISSVKTDDDVVRGH